MSIEASINTCSHALKSQMNLAALFSGGKDSTYAIYRSQKLGHAVRCLVTILTSSAESHLLHHPNIKFTKLQADAMKLPQVLASAPVDTAKELDAIKAALTKAKQDYRIQGVAHGGILSEFQKTKFENIAKSLDLQVIAPLWKKDQINYMHDLLDSGFEFIITAVSCDGLDDSWLGKKITRERLDQLTTLSKKHKFNLSFEGGEAETFVTNCPLFFAPIEVQDFKKEWDGYRGRFEIVHAKIKDNAG